MSPDAPGAVTRVGATVERDAEARWAPEDLSWAAAVDVQLVPEDPSLEVVQLVVGVPVLLDPEDPSVGVAVSSLSQRSRLDLALIVAGNPRDLAGADRPSVAAPDHPRLCVTPLTCWTSLTVSLVVSSWKS